MNPDPLLQQLGDLRGAPTVSLVERLYASVVRVDVSLPVGALFVAYGDQGISYVRPAGDQDQFIVEYQDRFERPVRLVARPPRPLAEAARTGRTRQLEYDLRGLSTFEQAVLRKALEIPKGETRPYGWVAAEIGRHRAVRAVGTALGHNPVPFLIPCHRVVRSDGTEGEYGFGPEMKRELLAAEQVNLDEIHELAARGTYFVASDTTGVVCYPSCHQARRITPPHRVGFRSVTQAVAAGFRPCQSCRPSPAVSA
jgi:methylated-DNA-[protein]-cysteine S-methyltransferase